MRRTASSLASPRGRRRLDPAAVASLLILRFGLMGCQRQVPYPVRGTPDAGFGAARVTVDLDDCPTVILTVSPSEARVGEPIEVRARVVDTDPGAPLAYAWTASASVFADPTATETTYTCPGRDHAGPQTITISASDGVCVATQSATVSCYALADGGGPATTPDPDSGAADLGAGCTQGDPTTCEGGPCNQCTNDNCQTLASAAVQGGAPIAGCDIFVSEEQQGRCQRLYACMRDSRCVQNSDPTRCWCGTVDPARCAQEPGLAAGPCARQFIDAAETNIPALIDSRLTDPNFPVGGAINLTTCRSVYCSILSDPPNPVCRL